MGLATRSIYESQYRIQRPLQGNGYLVFLKEGDSWKIWLGQEHTVLWFDSAVIQDIEAMCDAGQASMAFYTSILIFGDINKQH